MAKLFDLARVYTTTIGSGSILLGTPIPGCLSFTNAGVLTNDTISYGIIETTQSEVGRGVFNSSASSLTRNVLKSTNSNNPIVLSGSAQVYITALAEDFTSDPIVTKTSDYTLVSSDQRIFCNSTGSFTITLPVAIGSGKKYGIKNLNSGSILIKNATDTIDGETTQVIFQYDSIDLIDYSGNLWAII